MLTFKKIGYHHSLLRLPTLTFTLPLLTFTLPMLTFKEVKTKLSDLGIKILKHYSKLRIVKFEIDKDVSEINFDFFVSIEEEKEDFFI